MLAHLKMWMWKWVDCQDIKGRYDRKNIPQVRLDQVKLFWPEYMRRGRVRIWMLMWNTLAAPSDGEGKRRSLNRGSLRLIDITFSQFTPWTILSQYLPLPLTNFTSVFLHFLNLPLEPYFPNISPFPDKFLLRNFMAVDFCSFQSWDFSLYNSMISMSPQTLVLEQLRQVT